MTIVLYDIPSTAPGQAWSPNTWKTRYCLNYKGIPYRTEWIEYPDIAEHCKKVGISPTDKNRWDGEDLYTLPAIHDPSTGIYLAESWKIAEYLEKQYPDTPTVFPHGTSALQAAFCDAYDDALVSIWRTVVTRTAAILNPRSQEYFQRTREIVWKKSTEEAQPKGEDLAERWVKFRLGLNKVEEWYRKVEVEGPFIMGDTPSWGDFDFASQLFWMKKIWGEESKDWKEVMSLNEGRWAKFLNALEKYAAVH